MEMDRRRALIMAQQGSHSRLPAGFRELEWIGVDGTQYIKTNYAPTGVNPTRIYAKINTENTEIMRAFGARFAVNRPQGSLTLQGGTATNNSFLYTCYNGSSTGNSTYFGQSDSLWHEIEIAQSGSRVDITIDSTVYTGQVQLPRTYVLNLGIFAILANDTQTAAYYSTGGKIAELDFWEGDNLVRQYISGERESDGERGMYELCVEGFLTNAGTGTFRKGGYV